MVWKEIEGYKYRYRISDQAEIQRFYNGKGWERINTRITWNRLYANFRMVDGTQTKVAVVNLMDKYFFDGYARKNGFHIAHKNGSKCDCAKENLYFTNQSEIGKKWGKIGPRKSVIMDYKGEERIYNSVKEAAKKNGLTTSSLRRRILGEVLDEKGRIFRYE